MAVRHPGHSGFFLYAVHPVLFHVGRSAPRLNSAPRCAFCFSAPIAHASAETRRFHLAKCPPSSPGAAGHLVLLWVIRGFRVNQQHVDHTAELQQGMPLPGHLRANRDASMLNTAPMWPSHNGPAAIGQNPGRWMPDPEIPRSSSITSTSCHPSRRASFPPAHTAGAGFPDCFFNLTLRGLAKVHTGAFAPK